MRLRRCAPTLLLAVALTSCSKSAPPNSTGRAGTQATSATRSVSAPPIRRTPSRLAPLDTIQLSQQLGEQPTALFHVLEMRIGKAVSSTGTGTSDRMESVALVFPRLPAPGRCLAVVRLVVPNASADSLSPLTAYASAAISLAHGRVPATSSGGPETLLDNRPSGAAMLTPGKSDASFDVTGVARLWVDGAAFPSRDRAVAAGTPFILVVRPPDFSAGHYAVVARSVARLEILHDDRC